MVTQFRIDIHAHLRPDDAAPSKMPTPEELLLMYEKAGMGSKGEKLFLADTIN